MANPLRSDMTDLLTKLRLLINDPSSAQFSDQDLQDALDETRTDVRYEEIAAAPTLSNSGGSATYQWLDYYSSYQWWEADVVIVGASFQTITPTTSDLLVGHWTFPVGAQGVGQVPPLFATGKTYDLYAAAANLLDYWAASVSLQFDFGGDGRTYRPSQMAPALQAMAEQYRRKARATVWTMRRDDVTSGQQPFGSLLGDIGDADDTRIRAK